MGELECVADIIILFPLIKQQILEKRNIVKDNPKRFLTHPVILPLRGKDILSTITKIYHLIENIFMHTSGISHSLLIWYYISLNAIMQYN
jgi:hypothetical protein